MNIEQTLRKWAAEADSRLYIWERFINASSIKQMAEVGVYQGKFAACILEKCQTIKEYYLIDPWRHLADWNKPSNRDDAWFEELLAETMASTEFAAEKRTVLRGTTTEVIESIPDNGLDFAYIDGDHTLKGITIDLINIYPKIREGGWIGGDDFSKTVWQHRADYEPSLVFPYAVYFAEAVGNRIYALPFDQFLIEKRADQSFAFIDLTGHYGDVNLRKQFRPIKVMRLLISAALYFPVKLLKRLKKSLFK